MGTRRAEWSRRVREWRRSGLTAREFAERIGVKGETLRHWAWQLGWERRQRQAVSKTPERASTVARASALVEVVGGDSGGSDAGAGFELLLADGRRLRIAPSFDAGALERLLEVLERLR